jgi:SAM-dependent methyltransferase
MNGAEGVWAGTRMVASTEALAHRATSAGFSPQGRAGGARAVEEGLTNVRFLVADGATVTLPEPVDMVVGRLVLMYLPDPAAVIRHLRTALRDDGVLAFQEFDLAGATSEPRCPLFELAIDRIRQTFGRTGIDARMGPHLGRHFEAAGLPAPALSSSAKVERGPDARIYRQLAGITRAASADHTYRRCKRRGG